MTCCARCTRKPFLNTCGNEHCRCHPITPERKQAVLDALRGNQARMRHLSTLAGNRNPDNEGNPR